jgi:activating signal cointegrator complex subunit 3
LFSVTLDASTNAALQAKLNRGPNQPAPATSTDIVVQTESEKRIMKQIRKEEKRLNKLAGGGGGGLGHTNEETGAQLFDNFNPNALKKLREEQLTEAKLLQLYSQKHLESLTRDSVKKANTDAYPFVFDNMVRVAQTSAFIAGSKILLPSTMTRVDMRTHEEIHIPAGDSIVSIKPELLRGTKEEVCLKPLVTVDELDEIGRLAFRGVKTLNRIQSIVFDTAYNTNQNLLICAPTGAGKTNIAMLTVVNQIRKHIINGVLHKDEFKIVYVAPMKALAAEMVENFSKRLAPLGVAVRELTGDMQLTKQEILQTQMLVTTPEKWDVVTRKSTGDVSLSLLVKLLIIDEVHLLHDDRGSVIETIVARTLRQVETGQKMIRIVGLSATLPNYQDVARFLNVDPKR